MIDTPERMKQLVDEQLNRFRIVEKEFLLPYLVPPSLRQLKWDYSWSVSYPSWEVAVLQQKSIGIFHSEYGHGKHHPWGAIHISDLRYGMDDRWFISLEDAVINSGCWRGELPEDYEID